MITPKRRVAPRFPKSVSEMGVKGDVTCNIRFFIDTKGKPVSVDIDDECPAPYHQNIREAAMQWSFYPYKNHNGKKVEANFDLSITFRLK